MSVQRKKAFEVIKATKDPIDGLDVDGKYMKFGKYGGFVVHDPGEAQYIEDAFGSHSKTGSGDVVVCEVDNAGKQYPRRVFSINAPWKDKDDSIT
jgi:hypothetical protein